MAVVEELGPELRSRSWRMPLIIGVIGFLTLVDLFAAQAILPSLAKKYGATASEIGFAANACTIGMAVAGLVIAFAGGRINRRAGAWVSLAALSAPTFALAFAPDLAVFTALRVCQGVFMVAAFSMTMSYLTERCSAAQSATALAAYVTGVVASNLAGRMVSGALTDSFGVSASFFFFAVLNLVGALIAAIALTNAAPLNPDGELARSPTAIVADHLKNACLRTSFAIGFLILFAFIGVFTYVNFVLAAQPISLSPMTLGLVYFVFLPSMATTPFAGAVARRVGARSTFIASLALSVAGLPLLLSNALPPILAGLAIVGVGTFFAQATATGFVGRAAKHDRAAASGMYLSFYYFGGLVGSAVLGRIFEASGWRATVAGVAAALTLAGILAATLKRSTAEPAKS